MVTFRRGFEVVEEKKKIYTPSLKIVLRGLGVLHHFINEKIIIWVILFPRNNCGSGEDKIH
jgi:hypothetical protein